MNRQDANTPDLAVRAGTALDAETAKRCTAAGARSLTSPGLVLEVVMCAKKDEIVVLPGDLTPTEMIAGWKAG